MITRLVGAEHRVDHADQSADHLGQVGQHQADQQEGQHRVGDLNQILV